MSAQLSPEIAASLFLTPMRNFKGESLTSSQVPDRLITTSAGSIATWQRGDGPKVLLVHGWSSTHADLLNFVDPLLVAGRHVISMDLPAHGKSDGQVASIPELADGILHVARAFGPLDAVIAHSIGCAAVGVALQRGMAVYG